MPEIINEKNIHQKILESLAKEIYEFLHGLYSPIMNVFPISENLRNFQALYSSNQKTVIWS